MAMMKKYRFGNGFMEMAFEYRTGELLELNDCSTGENFLKSHTRKRGMPFRFTLEKQGGVEVEGYPVRNMTLIRTPEWYTQYRESATERGKLLEITYPCIAADEKVLEIEVKVSIELLDGCGESFWRISYKCNDVNIIVKNLYFPALYGIYLGETWKDDVLYFPKWSGIRMENPAENMCKPGAIVGSRWMEYFQTLPVGGMQGTQLPDGAYCYNAKYGGSATMSWMQLCGDGTGLYMASYDPEFHSTFIHAETFGISSVGMGFHFDMTMELELLGSFQSHVFHIAIHHSDWHWGADMYRKWRKSIPDADVLPFPDWIKTSSGLVAHYDFRDQCGDIKHYYRDIPLLKEYMQAHGLKHVLFAGWDSGGFNVRMPQYTFDEELGTEEELAYGVRLLREADIHVTFYVNARYVNSEEIVNFPELFKESISKDRYGHPYIQVFKNKAFLDYEMCTMTDAWIEHLKDRVRNITDVLGGDGIYFDCLSSEGFLCEDKSHRHLRAEYARGCVRLLRDLTNEYITEDGKSGLCILGEHLSDIYAPYLYGNLQQSYGHQEFAFHEMHKYTFPECMIIDMIYPFRQSIRPSPVSYQWKQRMDYAFLVGSYFWIYDDEEYGTFRHDPASMEYLKNVIKLRDAWFNTFGRGIFLDDVPLAMTENVQAKCYRLDDGRYLVALKPINTSLPCMFTLKNIIPVKLLQYDFNHLLEPIEISCKDNSDEVICKLESLTIFVVSC